VISASLCSGRVPGSDRCSSPQRACWPLPRMWGWRRRWQSRPTRLPGARFLYASAFQRNEPGSEVHWRHLRVSVSIRRVRITAVAVRRLQPIRLEHRCLSGDGRFCIRSISQTVRVLAAFSIGFDGSSPEFRARPSSRLNRPGGSLPPGSRFPVRDRLLRRPDGLRDRLLDNALTAQSGVAALDSPFGDHSGRTTPYQICQIFEFLIDRATGLR